MSEFGPPKYIMSDNGSVFRSQKFAALLKRWEIKQILTCAYRSRGNGIIERIHRSVKRSAARSKSSVAEAVFSINNSSDGKSSSPYELLFSMKSKMPGVSDTRQLITRNKLKYQSSNSSYECCDRNPFSVGDKVYLKPVDGRCDITWSGPHRITKLLSNVSVIINNDGVARHVSHLRLIPGQGKSLDETYVLLPVTEDSESDKDDDEIFKYSSSAPKRRT